MPTAYLNRASLAAELQIGESTVDEMVRRGVLPRPIRLSSGCIRWRWADVDTALASLGHGRNDGLSNGEAEGIARGLAAAKEGRRGRAA